ncbi:HTH_Tnp_Tc3_2 domain-containing protein [Trichonephila clavipes]|nr:HTH_Tnp_Tc3_2 domain-containing protein [Trichonephila clavipes]
MKNRPAFRSCILPGRRKRVQSGIHSGILPAIFVHVYVANVSCEVLQYFRKGGIDMPSRIITHILKKNMQITGNHQMARIVRHNDESVKEGYIRNGGKEVKLFTNALKAFQCNNRIVMAQRKHWDDFLRGRIIGRLECERTQLEASEELGTAQSVISRR